MLIADKLWVPDSFADKALVSLNRAVREYDDRLVFGRNEINGDWVVARKMPHGQAPIPVLGFQYDLPEPEHVLQRLRECDTLVHTDQLDKMNAHNESIRDVSRAKADEGSSIAAEGWESFLHRKGKTPYSRSLPKRDPKQRSSS